MESVIIGIDLGGTNLRIGAVTPDNRMLAPRVMKSSIVADAKNPIGKICEIITGYIEQNQLENVEAISIGVPSSVENDKETVICTTNIRNRAGEVVFSHTNMAKDVRNKDICLSLHIFQILRMHDRAASENQHVK